MPQAIIDAIEQAKVKEVINLKQFGHVYDYVKFGCEVDEDDEPEFTWHSERQGWGYVYPTRGNLVAYFKTLKAAKRNFIKTRLTSEHFTKGN